MSMTGYGRDVLNIKNTTITVEIRSVNHRFLDFSAKIPRSLLFLEEKIRKIIQTYFLRGRVEVYVGVEGEGSVQKTLKTDWDLMDQYVDQINKIQERYHLSGEIPVSIISTMPELMAVEEIDRHPDELKDSILSSIYRAAEQVTLMRHEEGINLVDDLKHRIGGIQDTVYLLQSRRDHVIKEYRERIKRRINEYVEENAHVDPTRMHQEIALLGEKGDITEEITRLLSHIDNFTETLHKDGAIGRTLDFIMQEMHREINTIGSKSTDTKIGEWVVSLKGTTEQIKEQVQNIE